jgi:hypothetical protein
MRRLPITFGKGLRKNGARLLRGRPGIGFRGWLGDWGGSRTSGGTFNDQLSSLRGGLRQAADKSFDVTICENDGIDRSSPTELND